MSGIVYKQADRLAQRRIAGELFVVDPAHRCLHQPLDAGESLWEWLRTGAHAEELVEKLVAEYEVSRAEAEKDVKKFLRELKRKKLIEEVRRRS